MSRLHRLIAVAEKALVGLTTADFNGMLDGRTVGRGELAAELDKALVPFRVSEAIEEQMQ